MDKILNKCPICGSKLEYSALMQYSDIYAILENGKLSKNRVRRENNGPMECGYIGCVNSNCDFSTDCDLDALTHREIKILCEHGVYMHKKNN